MPGALTPEQYAEMIQKSKPYLVKVEEAVSEAEYGVVELSLTVRAGVVEKIEFVQRKRWLKDKT